MRLFPGIATGCLSVMWAASGGVPVCHAEDALRTRLSACAKLGDNRERLTCYDRLTRQSSADPVAPIPPSAAAPEVPRTELKSITARVVSLREPQRGGALLTLDNGQQWRQLGTEDLLLKPGDGVKISRGLFDSFILMTDGNRMTHVKRIE